MTTILIVDDERNLVELIQEYLAREGLTTVTAYDGITALDLIRTQQPDLVVLDLMLPGLDGIEVCRQMRQFSAAYVLMLTSRAEEVDKLIGLAVGADDYMTKPFSPRELVARIKAILRRSRNPAAVEEQPARRRFGDLLIDEAAHAVTRHGEPVTLTAREYDLLRVLASHPGRVFTRAQLLEQVWGDTYYDEHVVDVHIANLRKKLEDDPGTPVFIVTVRGAGYRFEPGKTL